MFFGQRTGYELKLLHPDTKRQLNFDLWKKLFEEKIGLNGHHFFKQWFDKKYGELSEPRNEDMSQDDKWKRIAAILSIAHHDFESLELSVPERWRMLIHPYTETVFSLGDVNSNFPYLEITSWLDRFSQFEGGKLDYLKPGNLNEPWWLRKELLDEYVSLYFDEVLKRLAGSGIERNKKVRDLVFEMSFYRKSLPISNAFYRKVGPFVEKIKDSKSDLMVGFVKKALPAIFHYSEDNLDRKSIVMGLLETYWQALRKIAKSDDLVNLISDEVRELIDFLTDETGRNNGHDDASA